MDDNYWKRRYQQTWDASSSKEKTFKKTFEESTEYFLVPFGLGAESLEFIDGSAEKNGQSKGDPDFWVRDTDVYVEVTGPLSNKVHAENPLWIRPDKINAAKFDKEKDVFVVHYCPSADLWRTIHLDNTFFQSVESGLFEVVNPIIREASERYVAVPSADPCVKPLDYLYAYISGRKISNGFPKDQKNDKSLLEEFAQSVGDNEKSFRLVNYYLTRIAGCRRVVEKDFVSYKLPNSSLPLATIAGTSAGSLRILIALPVNEILIHRDFCQKVYGDSRSTELFVSDPLEAGVALCILAQIIRERLDEK